MLDFSKLKPPADHGSVLVLPQGPGLVRAARANNAALRTADESLLDSTLAAHRRQTREAIVGHDDALVIVTGHGPAFIHPGVWAKHVVAARLAAALDGVALNLVVDSDAARGTALPVPSVSGGRVVVKSVPFARSATGLTYEQIARQTPDQVADAERAVREAMAERFDGSQMPRFLAALRDATDAHDWVDRMVSARRHIESNFGVTIDDRRASRVWYGPLLLDMLIRAKRFATSYNRALDGYRREHRVRGARRPIPDLACDGDRCEAAVWVYRADEPRRRLFVAHAGNTLRLFAGDAQIGELPSRALDSCGGLDALTAAMPGWRIRPRALTLTLWARLLLADLFVHGIGGAKYDRITDAIIAEYFGLLPPEMACVSATLHLDLPGESADAGSVQNALRALRDVQHNPQRNLPGGPDIASLIRRRRRAVQRGIDLAENDRTNRAARRKVFNEIRRLNEAILARRPGALDARQDELARAVRELEQDRISRGREFFFGLYDRARLERMMGALPAERDFRV